MNRAGSQSVLWVGGGFALAEDGPLRLLLERECPGCVGETVQFGGNRPVGNLFKGLDMYSEGERMKNTIPKLLAQTAREGTWFRRAKR